MTEKTVKKSVKSPKVVSEVNKEIKEVLVKSPEITEVAVVDRPLVPSDYKSKLKKPQIELIKNTIAKGASDDELKMFLYVCERTRLDPFTKQIHLVPRWDSRTGKEIRTPIVGIDGLRAVAERTGDYAGNDDPVFDDEDKPTKATVTVYKMVQGQRYGFTASARYEQYVPKKADGTITSPLWKKAVHLMLGKCAEALALRKAFPAVMSGLYVVEEMEQAIRVEVAPTGKIEPNTGVVEVVGEVPEAPESNFDKASRIIAKMTSFAGLTEAKGKFGDSEKYLDREKKALIKVIDARIEELKAQENANTPISKA